MAFQHFYSRVPARISLYNRTDGFDTFAHSAALGDDFIFSVLSPIYSDKLRGVDVGKLRRGEISPVYFQCPAPMGGVVQSALSYIPRDYTGERSAYLVHSLVLDEAEKTRIFADTKAYVFNPDMFIKDISLFNVTAPNAAPNRNYPPVSYVAKRFINVKRGVAELDGELVKSFIYAAIMCACGEGKNIFFRLPCEDSRVSECALEFLNSVMAVLPYSFRERLSFVTYLTDVSQHGEFNIKCVSSMCRDVPLSKGIFFDFEAKTVKGVTREEIQINKPLTSFFYMLFDNTELRNGFHDYISRVTAVYGADVLELKTLSELVFLFWQCSGFYTERSVLPNDGMVYSFFSIFEKYKDALIPEYRCRAYKCLERYPREHLSIPSNIFEKLKSIYPTEKTVARRVALDVVLSLIHTDAMREELFEFIKSNYRDELPEVKSIISEDLSRVFYGGFLQNELLDFFDGELRGMPAEIQRLVVDKMLLAIRTASIQKKTVEILSKHYDALSQDLRLKIYATFFEMLSECDALASLLVDLVNANVNKEDPGLQAKVGEKIVEHLDLAYSRRNRRLLPILVEKEGFCENVVIRAIFMRQGTAEIYSDYLRHLATSAKRNKAMRLIHVFRTVPAMPEAVYERLLWDSKAAFGDSAWATLYDVIGADRFGAACLPTRPLELLRSMIIYPAVMNSVYDVFKVRYGKDGVGILKRYAEGNAYLLGCERYKAVEEYVALVDAAVGEDTESVFLHLTRLPNELAVRRDISEHIRMCSLNKNTQSEKTALLFELSINVLKDSMFRFDAVFTQYKNLIIQNKKSEFGNTSNPEKVVRDSIAEAASAIIRIAIEICYAHSDYIELVCSESSGISRVISNFVLGYGYGYGKLMKEWLKEAPEELRSLADFTVKECKSELPGITDRVKSIFKNRP